MRRFVAVVAVTGVMATACSDDPTSSEQYQELEQQLAAAEQRAEEFAVERDAAEEELAALEADGVAVPDERGSSDSTQDGSTAPSAFHAIPDDSVGVTGTAACSFGHPEGETDRTEEDVDDFVTCELEMSDPRVGGTETHDRFRHYYLGADAFAWVVEEAVITNDDGTWRGIIQAGDDGTPIGEAHYVGEGGYAGLEFHYYFSDATMATGVKLRGWIHEGGS